MASKQDIEEMLVSMEFQPNYIQRAFGVYEKHYGHSYNAEVIVEMIVRLQEKDKTKMNKVKATPQKPVKQLPTKRPKAKPSPDNKAINSQKEQKQRNHICTHSQFLKIMENVTFDPEVIELIKRLSSGKKEPSTLDVIRFSEEHIAKKHVCEILMQQQSSNIENYIEYAHALMGLGQREAAFTYIQKYWRLCNQNLSNLISVIMALTEGECCEEAVKYCKIGSNMIKYNRCIDDDDDESLKVRFYIHYFHVMITIKPINKIIKLLKKALFLLNESKTRNEGRIYQMRLQLASDFFDVGYYHISLQQMELILKYTEKAFKGYFINPKTQISYWVNKSKMCRIYGQLMIIKNKYSLAIKYLMETTDEYHVNGHLMKCYIERNQCEQAMTCYLRAVEKQKEALSINNVVLDFQHCVGLYLYLCLKQSNLEEATTICQYLVEFEIKNILHCSMAVFYIGYYFDHTGDKFTALLHYMKASSLSIRKSPEIYYHFALCLLNVGNVILSRKYVKKILKYNNANVVTELHDEIERKYKKLVCIECKRRTTKLKVCGACGRAIYCSKSCQKRSWNRKETGHKMFCDGKFRKFCNVRKSLKRRNPTKRMVIPMHDSVYHK